MPKKEITIGSKSGSALSSKSEMLYLLNLKNGRILPWSPILAVKRDMVDCDALGNIINPKDIPADHPYIRQEATALRNRLYDAAKIYGSAAADHVVADFGRHLAEQGGRKLRQLAYDKAKDAGVDAVETKEAKEQALLPDNPYLAGLYERIDKHAEQVKDEIEDMTLAALHVVAGIPYRRYRRCEVAPSYIRAARSYSRAEVNMILAGHRVIAA